LVTKKKKLTFPSSKKSGDAYSKEQKLCECGGGNSCFGEEQQSGGHTKGGGLRMCYPRKEGVGEKGRGTTFNLKRGEGDARSLYSYLGKKQKRR